MNENPRTIRNIDKMEGYMQSTALQKYHSTYPLCSYNYNLFTIIK